MSRSEPVTRLRGNKTPAAPLSPITEKSSPLSNFPLSARPSPTVSRTWVHDNVTIARGSKRKLADRQVDTVLAAFRLERHGALSASAVACSNEIPASQRDHARRLDFLQTTWPQGNIVPLRFLDPFSPELSWHLVNDLYFITKAFIKANIPLSDMWEDPVADNSLSPRGLLVRQMAICHVSHITTKVTQSARREVKSSGWPLLTPPQPLVSGAPPPKPIRQRAVSVSPNSSPLHHRPPAGRPAPRAHSVPLLNMLAQRPEDARNERLQTPASDKRHGSQPLGLYGMDCPMPADDKEDDNGMLCSIPPAHNDDNDDDWVSDDALDSDPSENETPEQSRRARVHSTGTNGLDGEIGQPVFAFPPSTPEINPSPFHFSTIPTEMSPLLDDQSTVNDLISGLPSSPLPVAEGDRPTSLPAAAFNAPGRTLDNGTLPLATIAALQQDRMLSSFHINDILTQISPPKAVEGWRWYWPGFPSDNPGTKAGDSCLLKSARHPDNLLFITQVDNDMHWAVVHLDRQAAVLRYYDSLVSSERFAKVCKLLGPWIHANNLVDGLQIIDYKLMKCPQQTDGVNCGVFAIEIVRVLLLGHDIPDTIDPRSCRREYVSVLEKLHKFESEPIPAEKQLSVPQSLNNPPVAGHQHDPRARDALLPGREKSHSVDREDLGPGTREAKRSRMTGPSRIWSQTQLQAGAQHVKTLAPQLFATLRSQQTVISNTLVEMRATDSRLNMEAETAEAALDKMNKEAGGNFIMLSQERLNEIKKNRKRLLEDRETKESTIVALQQYDAKHKEQIGSLAHVLPDELFQDVKAITEKHLDKTQTQLTSIIAKLWDLTRDEIQEQCRHDAAVRAQNRIVEIEQERRQLLAGIAWLGCLE